MASVDLVFAADPLLTGDLVFGDDGSSTVSDAVISGAVTLSKPSLSGSLVVGFVIGGAVTLAKPMLRGEVTYSSDTQRPLTSTNKARWQDADPQAERTAQRWQNAVRRPVATEDRWQDALRVFGSSEIGWSEADRSKRPESHARFQDGAPLSYAARSSFTDALRGLRLAPRVRWQEGVGVRAGYAMRFQDATRGIAGQHRTRYQDAIAQESLVRSIVGSGLALNIGWGTRYQEGMAPRPGRTVLHPTVPPGDPCYVPDTDLVFEALMSADTDLVFVCDRHGGPGPDPDPETVVVPIRRIYTVINTASLRRVVGNVLIPATAMSLTIDVDSWTWGFTARVPGAALSDLEPAGGVPVELEATINGVAYRAIVEGISRDRTFGRSDLTITGRGRSAVLDAPYSSVMTFGNSDDRTVQQLANDVLTFNGVSLGWDVDAGWKPEDWLVPAGVFSHQGTYMSALNAIAADAGAYVQSHRADKALQVLMRYPRKPWEWGDVVPDFELPADVVQKEGIVWTDKPNYNRVFVRGMKSGRLGQVTRLGTAGDIEAPMVTAQLGTNAIGLRQRALPVLADTGRQAAVSLRLPVLAETGIIPPGKFVRYVDGGTTRIGLVRSVSAEVARADKVLTIWQTIGVETHV